MAILMNRGRHFLGFKPSRGYLSSKHTQLQHHTPPPHTTHTPHHTTTSSTSTLAQGGSDRTRSGWQVVKTITNKADIVKTITSGMLDFVK